MVLERGVVEPLAGAEADGLRTRLWVSKRRPQRFEFLGGLVPRKHVVLATTVANVSTTIVARVLKYQEQDGTLTELLKPERDAVRRLGERIMYLTQHAPATQPMAGEALVAAQTTARKQKRMQVAMASLNMSPLVRQDAEVQAFGKREKLKIGKPLRIIQARSDRYLYSTARYLKPMEKGLYRSINKVLGYTAVMKGLNGVQRAAEALRAWQACRNPRAVSVDIKKFDAATSADVIEQEHRAYTRCVPGDTAFATMLRWQLKNKGRAMCDDGVVKYQREGGRMSGDANTSLGNIIICTAAHIEYAATIGVAIQLLNDGDDSVIVLEADDLPAYLAGVEQFWLSLGYRVSIDGVTDEFSRIDFCQCRPVEVAGEWAFVRNPVNAIQKDLVNPTLPADHQERQAWYAAVGCGGLSQLRGVPMYDAFYTMLKRVGKHNMVKYQWRTAQEKVLRFTSTGLRERGGVASSTRVSFWEAFGITPVEQIAFENACQNFTIIDAPDHNGTPTVNLLGHLLSTRW